MISRANKQYLIFWLLKCSTLYYIDTFDPVLRLKITMESEILTIKEVAEYLKVNERTIYRLANKGKIPAFRVGNNWRFERAKIAQWIQQQSKTELG